MLTRDDALLALGFALIGASVLWAVLPAEMFTQLGAAVGTSKALPATSGTVRETAIANPSAAQPTAVQTSEKNVDATPAAVTNPLPASSSAVAGPGGQPVSPAPTDDAMPPAASKTAGKDSASGVAPNTNAVVTLPGTAEAGAPVGPASVTAVTSPPPVDAAAKAPAAVAAVVHPGRKVYEEACASCHDKGTGAAPAIGDKSVWSERFAHGLGPLVRRVADGFPGHPSARRQGKLSDTETGQAVDYIMAQTFWPSNR